MALASSHRQVCVRLAPECTPSIRPLSGLSQLPQGRAETAKSSALAAQRHASEHSGSAWIGSDGLSRARRTPREPDASSAERCTLRSASGASGPARAHAWAHRPTAGPALLLPRDSQPRVCAQAFARLSAVYGGTYMLSKPDARVAYEGGVAVGVTAEGETARAKLVVGDPSYFPDKVQRAGRVRGPPPVPSIRCVLGEPVEEGG